MNTTVTLTEVAIAFAKGLYTAEAYEGSKPKYSCKILLDPADPKQKKQLRKLEKVLEQTAREGLKVKKLSESQGFLRDGDTKSWDGFEGKMYVSASSLRPPQVVNRAQQRVSEVDLDAPYSGSICNVVLSIAENPNFGGKVCAYLEVVQFVKDGERFGGGGNPEAALNALPQLEDEDDDDDNDDDLA